MSLVQFRESLVASLVLDMPFEKLKTGPRQQPASQSKRQLADHKFEGKEGSARNVRRRCASCYEKSREQQSREASRYAKNDSNNSESGANDTLRIIYWLRIKGKYSVPL
jgi:hypothetical protein